MARPGKSSTPPPAAVEDQSGNAYGCGYTGKSGGGSEAAWIQETVHLSEYAGKKVQLRFEYVTDAALNGEGLCWMTSPSRRPTTRRTLRLAMAAGESAGFARIENVLPQTFRLALVTFGNGGTTVRVHPGRR